MKMNEGHQPKRAAARDNLIERAKNKCLEHAGSHERRWLMAMPASSYGDETYKVELFVLEGSNPKAYVLAAPTWVKAFDGHGVLYRTWLVEDEFQRLLSSKSRFKVG